MFSVSILSYFDLLINKLAFNERKGLASFFSKRHIFCRLAPCLQLVV
jgi:hypothetical protein